jgi:hypothetical protein
MGLTKPSIQWVPGAISPGVKWPSGEAAKLTLTSAEANKTSTLPHVFKEQCLIKRRDNFTLHSYLTQTFTTF